MQWHLGTQFSGGLGSAGGMVRLRGLKDLFQPKWSYDYGKWVKGVVETILFISSKVAKEEDEKGKLEKVI